jgi:hypothetical protein
MRKSDAELQAAALINSALTLALAWKDATPGKSVIMAFSDQYTPIIQRINKAVPVDQELADAVAAEYKRVAGQLPRV